LCMECTCDERARGATAHGAWRGARAVGARLLAAALRTKLILGLEGEAACCLRRARVAPRSLESSLRDESIA